MAFDAGKKGEENSDVDFIPVGETREFSVAVDSAPGESDRTVKIGNQYKIILLTVLSFVIVVLLYRIFILDDGKSFPLIAPGAYYGQIVGLRSEGDRQSFYIERDDAQNLLHVVILAADGCRTDSHWLRMKICRLHRSYCDPVIRACILWGKKTQMVAIAGKCIIFILIGKVSGRLQHSLRGSFGVEKVILNFG
jgi:hypothetical protein